MKQRIFIIIDQDHDNSIKGVFSTKEKLIDFEKSLPPEWDYNELSLELDPEPFNKDELK